MEDSLSIDLIKRKVKLSTFLSLFLLSLLFFNTHVLSQNLLENGSFEAIYKYPYSANQVDFAIGWFTTRGGGGSSELYHEYDSSAKKYLGVPDNYNGFQHACHGKGYAGQMFYVHPTGSSSELIEYKLSKPLEREKNYCVSFYVSLTELSCWATKDIGLYFSRDTIKNSHIWADTIVPQVQNNLGIIDDTLNWVKISGNYLANGGEQFITIGDFFINRPSNFKPGPCLHPDANFAYYYIDAIAVYPCNALVYVADGGGNKNLCLGGITTLGTHNLEQYQYYWFTVENTKDTLSTLANPQVSPDTTTTYVLKVVDFKYEASYDTVTVFISKCGLSTQCTVYPNPANNFVTFSFNKPIPPNTTISLFDLTGKLVSRIGLEIPACKEREVIFPVRNLNSGIYSYRILLNKTVPLTGKLVVIKHSF